MNDPATVREAMVAQLLGEMGVLLKSVERVTAEIENSTAGALDAAEQLGQTVDKVKADVDDLANIARRRTAEYVMRASEQARQQSAEEQVNALRQVARNLVGHEVTPAVRELAAHLRSMAKPPLTVWLVHALIALLVSSVSSFTVAAILLRTLQ